MGRPPSNGAPTFRFTQAEIAEMESILQAHKVAVPERQVLDSLAEKFSNSEGRAGKIEVQMKQVWNWFQNRRYAIRAKAAKSPGILDITQMPQNASSVAVKPMTQTPQHPTVSSASVRTFPQPPQHPPSFSGRVTDNSQMEYEAKSARDGAWYDVSLLLSHRGLDTGAPEVLVRFAGFGAEEDEWVNVCKNVRQRSLPCESSECVAVLPADLILCFQEGKEQALYFDAHVLDAQRRRHDVRGCRCRFLVRYDHDQSEEIVALRKICRRPETDYRLQQLQAMNESSANQNKNGPTNNIHTVNTLRVYPPAEAQQKQHKVEPSSLAESPQKRQRLDAPVPAAPLGYVQPNQQSVQPAPSIQPIAEPQKVEPVAPVEPKKVEPVESVSLAPGLAGSQSVVPAALTSSDDVPHQLQKVQPVMHDSSTEAKTVVPSMDEAKPELQTVGATVAVSLPEASGEPNKFKLGSSVEVPKDQHELGPAVTPSTDMLLEVEVSPKLHEVQSGVPDRHHNSSPETKSEEPSVTASANDSIMVEDAMETKTKEPMVPSSMNEDNVVEVAIEAKTEETKVNVSGNEPYVVEVAVV